jgi:hypothetical protein
MVAKYQSGAKIAYVRVLPITAGRHLHVDCALEEFFGKKKTPKTTCAKGRVLTLLETCAGSTIDATVIAVFVVGMAKLPDQGLIRSLSAETGSANLRVRLTGGTLSVAGAPIRRITWSLRKEGSSVSIQIEGNRVIRVGENYLQESLEWAGKMLGSFVLQGTDDAHK